MKMGASRDRIKHQKMVNQVAEKEADSGNQQIATEFLNSLQQYKRENENDDSHITVMNS